jgi:hypothetical protein
MTRPPSRTRSALVIVSGSVVLLAFLICGLVFVVSSITAPSPYDLYDRSVRGVSCDLKTEHKGVIVVIPLRLLKYTSYDHDWRVTGINAIASKNAVVTGSDFWPSGVGFRPDETAPTRQMVEHSFSRTDSEETTADFRSSRTVDLAVAISPVVSGRPMKVASIRVISTGGEPEYFQDFRVDLNAGSGKCTASPAPTR